MANPKHLEILRRGVEAWNAWREREPSVVPDLAEADLRGTDLHGEKLSFGTSIRAPYFLGANLREANLRGADLTEARLSGADLRMAKLESATCRGADLSGANFSGARLLETDLNGANLGSADFFEADLTEAKLVNAKLYKAKLGETKLLSANLTEAKLIEAELNRANLFAAKLIAADLSRAQLIGADLVNASLGTAKLVLADLTGARLNGADFTGADLSGADLSEGALVRTVLTDAVLTGCRVYGISAWDVIVSEKTQQQNLIITRPEEPLVSIDDIEVAQFVYLLLNNAKIRNIIDTVGRKGVLLLGRFTKDRIEVLERLRKELRKRGFVPIIFNFDRPETKDFTETVQLLAGLSHFVIADITNPKSSPLELQATVPDIMVPFRPIIEKGEEPFAMLNDLWTKYPDWVFNPIRYSSPDRLVEVLDEKIIEPAKARFEELVARKAKRMTIEDV